MIKITLGELVILKKIFYLFIFKMELNFKRYFCINKNGNLVNTQKGVFRTNCIDCLDRTNVVQGLMAKRILHIQFIV